MTSKGETNSKKRGEFMAQKKKAAHRQRTA